MSRGKGEGKRPKQGARARLLPFEDRHRQRVESSWVWVK